MLFFFIDNGKIKFSTKNYHAFKINIVCVSEVCAISYASPGKW